MELKQTQGAQTAYSDYLCRYHSNSGNHSIPKARTPKVHNFTIVRTDMLHSLGITLHSLEQTYLRRLIHTTQMVKVHINNTKHITLANIYIPPRDSTSTHYKTADTYIQRHITNIPHSILIGDVNAHSTL